MAWRATLTWRAASAWPYTLESLGDFFARWLEINQHDVHDVNKSNVLEFVKKSQVGQS